MKGRNLNKRIISALLFITKNFYIIVHAYILILTIVISGALVYIIGLVEDKINKLQKLDLFIIRGK